MLATCLLCRRLLSVSAAPAAARAAPAAAAAAAAAPASAASLPPPSAADVPPQPNRVLVAYKRLLSLARRLPGAEDRARAAEDIRAAFRRSRGEADPAAIAALLRTAHDKLSYLRMVTPRLPEDGAGSSGAGSRSGGTRRLVMVEGELRELGPREGAGGGKAQSSYGAGNMDPDQVRRHEASLQRMRFLNRPGGVPKGPFGR